jgi:hypothetical protein
MSSLTRSGKAVPKREEGICLFILLWQNICNENLSILGY